MGYIEAKRRGGSIYYYLTHNRRAGGGWKKTRQYIGATLPAFPKSDSSPLDAAYKSALPVIRRLAKNRKIAACYLFGSYARLPRLAHDIDVCIISEGLSTGEMSRISMQFYSPLDISFMEKMPHYNAINVLREGKPLFISNKGVFSEKWLGVVREHLENQPMRERIYRGVSLWMNSQTAQTA